MHKHKKLSKGERGAYSLSPFLCTDKQIIDKHNAGGSKGQWVIHRYEYKTHNKRAGRGKVLLLHRYIQ